MSSINGEAMIRPGEPMNPETPTKAELKARIAELSRVTDTMISHMCDTLAYKEKRIGEEQDRAEQAEAELAVLVGKSHAWGTMMHEVMNEKEQAEAEVRDTVSDLSDEAIVRRRQERIENGDCPCCWADDESGHDPTCELGIAEAEVAPLKWMLDEAVEDLAKANEGLNDEYGAMSPETADEVLADLVARWEERET